MALGSHPWEGPRVFSYARDLNPHSIGGGVTVPILMPGSQLTFPLKATLSSHSFS